MTAAKAQAKEPGDLPMSATECDRIMGKALRVKPDDGKPKKVQRSDKKSMARK